MTPQKRTELHRQRTSRSRVMLWLLAHAWLTVLLTVLLLELMTLAVIVNWHSIRAIYHVHGLNAIYKENAVRSFEQLVLLDDLAAPALLRSVKKEHNKDLLANKMMLLISLRKEEEVPVPVRVRYYFSMVNRADWDLTSLAIMKVAKIGPPARDYVERVLATAYPLYQYAALCMLAEIGDTSSGPVLLPYLQEQELEIRKKALFALDKTGAIHKERKKVIEFLLSGEYRNFDLELQMYAVRVLAKLADADLDARMMDLLMNGRPFETRIAAGYFGLSSDLDQVSQVFEQMAGVDELEETRLEFLNSLKTRTSDLELQKLLVGFLGTPDLDTTAPPPDEATEDEPVADDVSDDVSGPEPITDTAGLMRFMASQYLTVAELQQGVLDMLRDLVKTGPSEVRWDAAIVLSYHNEDSALAVLAEAVAEGSKSARFARVSKLAAIALGESQNRRALELLVSIASQGDLVARTRAIYWGLRVHGINEGDWRVPPESKTVYPLLNRMANDLDESLQVRAFAKRSVSEIKTMPGQEPGNKVIEIDPGAWRFPIFTGTGKHINDIIKENLGLYEFPPYNLGSSY